MLIVGISSWCIRSVHASVTDTQAQCTYKFLTRMLSMFWRGLFKFGISTLMLRIRIRNWCQCSGYATVPDAHAQCTHQFLTCKLTRFWRDCAHCTHLFLTCMLSYTHQFLACMFSICISSWRACSVHTSASYMHIEGIQTNMWKMGKLFTHQSLTCILSMRIKVGACT